MKTEHYNIKMHVFFSDYADKYFKKYNPLLLILVRKQGKLDAAIIGPEMRKTLILLTHLFLVFKNKWH